MKKIITVFIAALLLCFCLSFTVSASDGDFTVSEDLQTVIYHGTTYHRTDLTAVSIVDYSDVSEQPRLTARQQEQLRSCTFFLDSSETVMEADFYFKDGSRLLCGFVSEAYEQQLLDSLESNETPCYIEFYWSEHPPFSAPESDFKGTATTLRGRHLQSAETFPVYVNNGIRDFQVNKGTMLAVNNRFYYVDHNEAEIYTAFGLDVYEYDSLDCYEITDPSLVADIEDALGTYYNITDGTEDLFAIAGIGVWVLIFGVIPAGILVMSIIFFLRGKGYYRRVWRFTAIGAVTALIMFAAVTILLM